MDRDKSQRLRLIASALTLATFFHHGNSSAAIPEEMALAVGDQHTLDARQIESFSESTRGIIEVKIPRDGRKMILTAVRPGSTSLLLIFKGGAQKTIPINVFAQSPGLIQGELEQLFGDNPNLSFRRIGPRIFIDGSVSNEAMASRIIQVERLYNGQVASLVRVDPGAVQQRTNIRFDLIFVELRKSDAVKFGLQYPGQIGAGGVFNGSIDFIDGSMTASYQIMDQVMPFLEAGQQAGWAKIRKKATLITTSGNEASYQAGGEINVAVAGSQAAELRTIPYGCQLSVLPHLAVERGILDIQVSAEVSELTETTQDIPGRNLSSVETLVHMGLGQTIVLSGLDSETKIKSINGIPLLSKIPILGLLFGGMNAREEQVDGIILITPTVVENIDREGKRALANALAKFEEFDGDFD